MKDLMHDMLIAQNINRTFETIPLGTFPNKKLTSRPTIEEIKLYGGESYRELNEDSIIADMDLADASPTIISNENGEDEILLLGTEHKWDGVRRRIPALQGSDSKPFGLSGNVLEKLPKWARCADCFWAPNLFIDYSQSKPYFLYYVCRFKTNGEYSFGISVARSDNPHNNFVDESIRPIVSGPGYINIDPYVYQKDSGQKVLMWGSNHAPIVECPLTEDGLTLDDFPKNAGPILFPGYLPYMDLIEAGFIKKINGWNIIGFSGSNTWAEGYGGYSAMYMLKIDDKIVHPYEINPERSHVLQEGNERFANFGHYEFFEYKGLWYAIGLAVDRKRPLALHYGQNGKNSFKARHKVRLPVIVRVYFDKYGLPFIPGGVLRDEEKLEIEQGYRF